MTAAIRKPNRRQPRHRQPAPEPTDGPCCTRLLIVTFRQQTPTKVEYKHMGRRCAGDVDHIPIDDWLTTAGLKP